jgi:hypothetical protein
MALTPIGEVKTTSPWGNETTFCAFVNSDNGDTSGRVTVAIYTGSATLHTYLSREQAQSLATLLSTASVQVNAPVLEAA